MAALTVGANGCTDQRWRTESIEDERRCEEAGEREREVMVSVWERRE